ncbi:MAG: MFS transporter, partial [Acidimicrobiia bacterium]|nr:MFS transporter [Acidimicrobiia bacterium]
MTAPAHRTHPLATALLLMWVMVAATAFTVTLPVLASALIEEFDITRTQFGLLGLAGGAVAAAGSPFAGRVTDRIGGRNGVLVVLAGSAGAAVLFAGAPVFGAMFAGAAVAAVAGAAGNPATNKLIAQQLEPGRRGMVTGLKQTGPQVGSFLSGALAPWGAATIGWRPTV